MEKNRCKICNKRFANGKAMGGHMRSHFAKLPLAPKPPNPTLLQPNSSSSFNGMQSYRSLNQDLVSTSQVPINLVVKLRVGGEGKPESPRNPSGGRSKRLGKSPEKTGGECSPGQVSSVSDLSEVEIEEAARSLVMLSRDEWTRTTKVEQGEEEAVDKKLLCALLDDDVQVIDEGENEGEALPMTRVTRSKRGGYYKCETCNKGFRSYQALGGHRATHKRISIEEEEEESEEGSDDDNNVAVIDQRVFKCPFCEKVFDSGQALGGHKKVHLSYLAASARTSGGVKLLDLNSPAPEDDDEACLV